MTGRDASGKPGLLLVCHGDFDEAQLDDPGLRRLYQACVESYPQHVATIPRAVSRQSLGWHVASFLSGETDGPVELACPGYGRPGIREALYQVASAGSRAIVFIGADGYLFPGRAATVHLPAAIGQAMAENAGLDVSYALPGVSPPVAASLILASLEKALTGRGISPRPSWEAPRIRDDTGVIVVSAPLPGSICPDFEKDVGRLSENLAAAGNCRSAGASGFLSAVVRILESYGLFCGVRAGYVDFSSPSLESAAEQLARAGAKLIIAAGLPLIMYRHPLSRMDHSGALERLKNTCPADIVYVPPDPLAQSAEIAAILRMRVLEAAAGKDIIGPKPWGFNVF